MPTRANSSHTELSCFHVLIPRSLFGLSIGSQSYSQSLAFLLIPANHIFHLSRGSLLRGCVDPFCSPIVIKQTAAGIWLKLHPTASVLRVFCARGFCFMYELMFIQRVHSELRCLTQSTLFCCKDSHTTLCTD